MDQQVQADSQLEYRLATPADKAQVVSCHGGPRGSIYNGLDYVEQRYDTAMTSWNKVCGLCYDRSAGMVVAYGQIFVLDNKRHMLLTALRVHREYQGRGIARDLRNFLCSETRKKFAIQESEVRFTVYNKSFSDPDFYAKNPDYQVLAKRNYYMTGFPLSKLPQLRVAMSAAAAAAVTQIPGDRPQVSWTDRRSVFAAMISDPAFRRLHEGSVITITCEMLELMEENLDILPGDAGDNAPSAIAVRGEEVTMGFGCLLYCARGLRADLDLYSNAIDRGDFSPDSLADTAAVLMLEFLARVLASESPRLAQMPDQSLTLFVSIDCFNRRGFDCPNCDLESRLDAKLRGFVSDDVITGHPFYSAGCPCMLIQRRLQI